MNDPLYNHEVFGPEKGKYGNIGKTDEELIQDLISIHNAENWLGMDGDSELSMFNGKDGGDRNSSSRNSNGMIMDENKDKPRTDNNDVRGETKGIHISTFFRK